MRSGGRGRPARAYVLTPAGHDRLPMLSSAYDDLASSAMAYLAGQLGPQAIEAFAEKYPDAVGPRTSLLILGDARNNYRATGSATLKRLVSQARHAYWLNPEPSAYWGSGDSVTGAYEGILEMVEVRNAVQLEDFVHRLLPQ